MDINIELRLALPMPLRPHELEAFIDRFTALMEAELTEGSLSEIAIVDDFEVDYTAEA